MKKIALIIAISIISSALTAGIMWRVLLPQTAAYYPTSSNKLPFRQVSSGGDVMDSQDVSFFSSPFIIPNDLTPSSPTPYNRSFVEAAYKTIPAVVHIKVTNDVTTDGNWVTNDNTYESKQGNSSGSGVIIDKSGYIVTNNHVVNGAQNIKVILANNTSYMATVVGGDPTTDIALLKIKTASNVSFPMLQLADSDSLMVGEWVLAVGNPFNLTSTVTAGIVSAKGRNINVLQEQFAVEAFIQTDAVINPGNSGGALVNTQGRLVGINTAIASNSGNSEGYSFAVPSNLVEKVVADLKKSGSVQRAYLGANAQDITSEIAQLNNLKSMNGVFIQSVVPQSAAANAGIINGDVILEVNGVTVNTVADLSEKIARFRPNDKVGLTIIRNDKKIYPSVTLKDGKQSKAASLKPDAELLVLLGAHFQELRTEDLQRMGIKNGIRIIKLVDDGLLKMKTNIRDNFIITTANNIPVLSIKKFNDFLKDIPKGNTVTLEGVYYGEDKGSKMYPFKIE